MKRIGCHSSVSHLGAVLRSSIALGTAGASLLAASGTASAQVISASATATPRVATFPSTTTVEFRLRLVTGTNPASVRIDAIKPGFGHGRVGTPLALRKPTLEGPGRLLRTVNPPVEEPSPHVCYRGYPNVPERATAEIPAGSTTTLIVPARLSSSTPPWANTSLRLGFKVSRPGRRPIRVSTSGPVRRGPRGVRIGLRVRTRWYRNEPDIRIVRQGVPLRLSGVTRPRLRRRMIALSLNDVFGKRRPIRTRVRTDGHGNFRAVMTPERAGEYTVEAAFRPTTRGPLVRDVSCTRVFTVIG